jgi:ketopantoate reductase
VCSHKAIDQSSVPAQVAPAVDAKKTTLVVIQNGVGNEEPFRQAFPDVTIITCVVSFLDLILPYFITPNAP